MNQKTLASWEVSPSSGRHFDLLDGLRGTAILMVVVCHSFYLDHQFGSLTPFAVGLIQAGWLGVPIFFVLSGFLISYPFVRKKRADENQWNMNGYIRRRIAKIVPPFVLSLLILTPFYYLSTHDPRYCIVAIEYIFGIPNFVVPKPELNGVYWSLIVEVHFYIVLPLLFLLTRKKPFGFALMIIFLSMLIVPALVRFFTFDSGATNELIYLRMWRFPCGLDYFAWGILFASIYARFESRRNDLKALGRLGIIGTVLLFLSITLWGFFTSQLGIHAHPQYWSVELFHIIPSAAVFFLFFLVFDPGCMLSCLFAWPALRFIGIVSYEWFLFHVPFIQWFNSRIGMANGNFFIYCEKTLLPDLLALGFAILVYRFFSLPLMRRSRQKINNAIEPEKILNVHAIEVEKTLNV